MGDSELLETRSLLPKNYPNASDLKNTEPANKIHLGPDLLKGQQIVFLEWGSGLPLKYFNDVMIIWRGINLHNHSFVILARHFRKKKEWDNILWMCCIAQGLEKKINSNNLSPFSHFLPIRDSTEKKKK